MAADVSGFAGVLRAEEKLIGSDRCRNMVVPISKSPLPVVVSRHVSKVE